MSNFGMLEAFLSAGFVGKFVIILLLLMSVYSWAVIFAKYKILKNHLNVLVEINYIADTKSLAKLETYVLSHKNSYVDIINLILESAKDKNITKVDLDNKIELTSKVVLAAIEDKVDKLATIASTAPFIGLLGTVIGVINSFHKIGETASASLDVIAPGIAEALYATALGLFVAIPASAFYNLINNKIEEYMEKRSFLINKIYYFINK